MYGNGRIQGYQSYPNSLEDDTESIPGTSERDERLRLYGDGDVRKVHVNASNNVESDALTDSASTIARLGDSYSIWGSAGNVWDSNRSIGGGAPAPPMGAPPGLPPLTAGMSVLSMGGGSMGTPPPAFHSPFPTPPGFTDSITLLHETASDPSGLFSPAKGPSSSAASANNARMPTCGSCPGDTGLATHYCVDCKDLLCNTCVDAHQRVRFTRDHKVISLGSALPRPPPITPITSQAPQPHDLLASPALSSVSSPHHGGFPQPTLSVPPPVVSICPRHDSKVLAVCEWCKGVALCSGCLSEHIGHKIVHHGDLRVSIALLLSDSKVEEKKIDDASEAIARMCERVEASVQSTASEMRSVVHMHISALEERKRELLSLLDQVRVGKISTLKTQAEGLAANKNRLVQLAQTADLVREEDDFMKLSVAFETLVQIYMGPRTARTPNENDNVKLVHPDPNLLTRLRTLGSLESSASSAHCTIQGEGYRRAIRERQSNVAVLLKDACGQMCRSKNQQVAATVIGPDGAPLDVTISEREGGTVIVTYVPMADGPHTLNITVRGNSINGCPASVDVRRGRNYEDIVNQGELFSFGREGSGDGELCRPWGICCDLLGRILVADRSNNRIQIFDKDGNYITKFGTPGTRGGQFDRPAGVTVNTSNSIIVADKDNHRVQVFDQDGNFMLKFGERGRPVGMFNYPWGVATNAMNHIAVSDTRNHRVQIFTSMGQFIRKCGFDSAYFFKHLDSPRGLCYLPDGHLLITDFNNHRLAVLSASRSSPDMKCYGSEGEGDGLFCRPQGVKTDPEGHILVCDSRNNRVQIFCGDDFRHIASFGGAPKINGFQMPQELPAPMTVNGVITQPPPLFNAPAAPRALLDRPTDLCISPEGRVYVVDFGNNCIRVF